MIYSVIAEVRNNTDLYLCELLDNEYGIKSNEKILYKIDDVTIYEKKEYLDGKILKKEYENKA